MDHLEEWIKIDPTSETPVYLQITNAFIHTIRNGRLRKGLKLPGSRTLAARLGINRMTMVAAYQELHAQGWIEISPRKGTFVNHELPVLKPRKITPAPDGFTPTEKGNFHFDASHIIPFPVSSTIPSGTLVLNDGFPDIRLAPTELLIRSMRRLSRLKAQRKFLMYGSAKGTAPLREVLANFLSDTRGIPVTANNLLITRGAQMGIYLAAGILLKPGDHLIVGEPGYFGANLTFRQLGARLNFVPVDDEGIDVEAVEKLCRQKKIRLVYVIPHHHHPTTVTLTPERRIRLLELSYRYRFAIIEDDYDYDFHYSSKPMMPMASLDRHGNTIYIGTLTKTLAPAFRVGFMTGPEPFIEAASHLRRALDWQGDNLLENAIAELYNDGTMVRHIKKAVRLYKERRDHFCQLLKTQLGEHVSFKVPDGGMSVWTKFVEADLKKVSAIAYKKGLAMSDGRIYNTHRVNYNSSRLGFASLNLEEQRRVVQALRASIHESLC